MLDLLVRPVAGDVPRWTLLVPVASLGQRERRVRAEEEERRIPQVPHPRLRQLVTTRGQPLPALERL